jgi:peptide/nickel transport system substrate-binding protein
MSRLIGLALPFLLAAVAAVAPALAQTPPNVLVVGQVAEPTSLDPHTVTPTNEVVRHAVSE